MRILPKSSCRLGGLAKSQRFKVIMCATYAPHDDYDDESRRQCDRPTITAVSETT